MRALDVRRPGSRDNLKQGACPGVVVVQRWFGRVGCATVAVLPPFGHVARVRVNIYQRMIAVPLHTICAELL
jgi:hypothetical protein